MSDSQKAKEQWDNLRGRILHGIAEIDLATSWQEAEPTWWLEMMRVRAVLLMQVPDKSKHDPQTCAACEMIRERASS